MTSHLAAFLLSVLPLVCAAASLQIQTSANSVLVTSPNRGALEMADRPTGPWTSVSQTPNPGTIATAIYSLPLGDGSKFFRARLASMLAFDMGTPALEDVYVSPAGNDNNPGSREKPLRHLGAAWRRIPERTALSGSGLRINLLPGTYDCEGDCMNYFAHRWGSFETPVIIRAADGPGTVTLLGGLNLEDVRHLYLLDLRLRAGVEAAFGNNVLHVSNSRYVLVRNCTVEGPRGITDASNTMQEVFKANQCEHVYVEHCDLSGTYQTVLDFFAVRHGHVVSSKLHRAGGRGAYVKGGSAYLRFEANEIYDCREAGFQAGEGSNFTLMQEPWIHYEAYDIKVVNNTLRDIYGAGLSVAGGYNILMAHNTLYKVGLQDEAGRSWSLAQFIRGTRVTATVDEFPTTALAAGRAGELIGIGGWGTARVTPMDAEQAWIPNRNVFIYNNVFCNPAGTNTDYTHFLVLGAEHLPTHAANIPNPARTDDNLRIAGNIVWNGPSANLELIGSYGGPTGCLEANPACNSAQIERENRINTLEPDFAAPGAGDFKPMPGGPLSKTPSVPIPDFTWIDAPAAPKIPPGELSNAVLMDAEWNPRENNSPPGAWR